MISAIESDDKKNFKLADYFVTVGFDDYHMPEEVHYKGKGNKFTDKPVVYQTDTGNQVALEFQDPEEEFDKVVSKLEIYVIKD